MLLTYTDALNQVELSYLVWAADASRYANRPDVCGFYTRFTQ